MRTLGGTVQAHRAAAVERTAAPGILRVERAMKDALDPAAVLA